MAARITAYIVAAIVSITFIAGLIVGAQRDENGPVDLIVLNGRVYTADEDGSFAEAVAIQGNRILRVGTTRDISRLKRAQTVVVDAKGGAVLPGFNDAHAHLLEGGRALAGVDLSRLSTLDAVEQEIAMWARLHPDAPWIVGRGWRYEMFPGGLPSRQLLDRAAGHRPVFLTAADGHTGWANTAALEAAGITRQTADPAHGAIVRDPRSGEPSGALRDAAMTLVTRHIPPAGKAAELAALKSAIGEAHRLGVTSVHDIGGGARELALLDELRRDGDLDLRVYEALPIEAPLSPQALDALAQTMDAFPDDPLLKAGAVAIDLDGSVESRTAALLAPYAGQAENAGEPWLDQQALNTLVATLDARGWQVMIRTAGDRAVRMALDALEHAAEVNPVPERGRRHRLEHVAALDPADLGRLGALGVLASMQPSLALPVMAGAAPWSDNLGAARAGRGWPMASVAEHDGRLVFGSDWPRATLDPRAGLHVAVNRTTYDGRPRGGWQPDERLPLAAAIDAYTRDAAWASFDDHRKGAIAEDMLADLVVLSTDIFAQPAAALAETEVELTIFDGNVVYDRSSFMTRRKATATRTRDAN